MASRGPHQTGIQSKIGGIVRSAEGFVTHDQVVQVYTCSTKGRLAKNALGRVGKPRRETQPSGSKKISGLLNHKLASRTS